jgi:hypothetical protein
MFKYVNIFIHDKQSNLDWNVWKTLKYTNAFQSREDCFISKLTFFLQCTPFSQNVNFSLIALFYIM